MTELEAGYLIHTNMRQLGVVGTLAKVVKKFQDYEICHRADFTAYEYQCLRKLMKMGLVDKDEDEGFFDLSNKGYELFKQPMRDALKGDK